MTEPSFDRDGYPTEETLKTIREWDIVEHATLPAFLAKAWKYPDSAREVRPGLWAFATGGWSGNESLLGAMHESLAWQILAWDSIYIPGGLQVIAVTDSAKREMEDLHHAITQWAWANKPIPILLQREYSMKKDAKHG